MALVRTTKPVDRRALDEAGVPSLRQRERAAATPALARALGIEPAWPSECERLARLNAGYGLVWSGERLASDPDAGPKDSGPAWGYI